MHQFSFVTSQQITIDIRCSVTLMLFLSLMKKCEIIFKTRLLIKYDSLKIINDNVKFQKL